MHRARTAFNLLNPVGQQNFGSWLVRQQKSKVSFFLLRKDKKNIRIIWRILEECPSDSSQMTRDNKIFPLIYFPDCKRLYRRNRCQIIQFSRCWTVPQWIEHGLCWGNVQCLVTWSSISPCGKIKKFIL